MSRFSKLLFLLFFKIAHIARNIVQKSTKFFKKCTPHITEYAPCPVRPNVAFPQLGQPRLGT